jgi:predicted choloylglycine hydrolase
MLSLYDPPPLVTGCTQAVRTRGEPLLVRNYDFDPALLEGVILLTALTGRRVLGTSDCLWGLLDGVNEAGLAMSLAFGGRRVTAPGFAMPLIVRYLLELCATTQEAVAVLSRLPVQASYNLTILDREGDAVTAHVGPDHPAEIGRALVATNHQRTVDWPEHAEAVRSEEREQCVLELLDAGVGEEEFVAAFLEPPLHNTAYADGFGTLYTAAYRPLDAAVEYRWPGLTWRQSCAAFEEGMRAVRLPSSKASINSSHEDPGQENSALPSSG